MRKDRLVRKMSVIRTLTVAALLCVALPAAAQIQLTQVMSGLSSPVYVGHAGDNSGRLFVLEQAGIIKVLQPGATQPSIFLDIRSKIAFGGERGLLGLAFHPSYSTNRRFFVFYTRLSDGDVVIAEYGADPADPNRALSGETILLTIEHSSATNHNGGMLAFGPDGYLYIGVGDGGGANDPPNNAQNKNNLLGKVLRIAVGAAAGGAYTVPGDNPFVNADGADEIYAYGMRNPWRFSFDRELGHAWVGDVGQGAREEVDTPLVSGGNYGWRVFEGSICTSLDPALCSSPQNYIAPVFDYTHANGRCSLTGGYVYRGGLNAVAEGTYIYGDYCSGEIFAWNGSAQTVLLDTAMRISSFGEDEQGELYVVDLNGSISRIAGTTPPPQCSYSITPTRATFGAAGGPGTATVTAPAGCAWTAESNSPWITVTGGASGSGPGTVTYSVAAYSGKPKNRNGSLTIAQQTLSVKQSR